jgi:hypothetical protein
VLRSKGTVWVDSNHRAAAEWSQAGRHLQLKQSSAWWATLPPEIMRAVLSSSKMNTTEESDAYKAELANFGSPSLSIADLGSPSLSPKGDFGDRRQEIVFIGTDLDTPAIEHALDSCLLTDTEMQEYVVRSSQEDRLIAEKNGPFRFAVGTRVKCNMDTGWQKGIVVQQYYREPEWPVDQWTPYQIHLDTGLLIFAPSDIDACIRRA